MEIRRIGSTGIPVVAGVALAGAALGAGRYASRIRTMASVHQVSNTGTPYNLYAMDVRYRYDLDRIIERGLAGEQENMDALLREALPLIPVHVQAPNFACSAFAYAKDGYALMGRNYDFRNDTSALMVHCAPKDGYESIAFCSLDNLAANDPFARLRARFACLAAPLICLDGVNEKGLSIAVLTLDSIPVHQVTGKPTISTPIAIRLVLDRAATTQEAIDLLLGYDMYATNRRDYHFYISDATGDGRVLEYDCDSPTREPVVTRVRQITNYFAAHADKAAPNQYNGIYGHGRERADAIDQVLDAALPRDNLYDTAWKALRAASQKPNPDDITSNTQWSIVFDNKRCSADIVLRRRWDQVYHTDITGRWQLLE